MSKKEEVCALCKKNAKLQDSHLIPKAIFRSMRKESQRNPNPVIVSEKYTKTSSLQVSGRLLCEKCEQRFSKAESYVCSLYPKPNGSFKLRELLRAQKPVYTNELYELFDVKAVLGRKIRYLVYFAASIFWRASVKKWRWEKNKLKGIQLGGRYQEMFRRYLLDDRWPSEYASLILQVTTETRVPRIVSFPTTCNLSGYHRHKFYIPGLLFVLFLGGKLPLGMRSHTLASSETPLVFLCPFEKDNLHSGILRFIKQSKPVHSLIHRKTWYCQLNENSTLST